MTSQEERRGAQLEAISNQFGERDIVDTYDMLLAYFDENEPETADLIRNGGDRESTGIKDCDGQLIRVGDIVNSEVGRVGYYMRVVVRDKNRPELRFEPITGSTLCRSKATWGCS
jgi:hypothetical protein